MIETKLMVSVIMQLVLGVTDFGTDVFVTSEYFDTNREDLGIIMLMILIFNGLLGFFHALPLDHVSPIVKVAALFGLVNSAT